jgi:UDP-3-O-[3-hydroxymyristoyl] glucosamine N-acyltransferase
MTLAMTQIDSISEAKPGAANSAAMTSGSLAALLGGELVGSADIAVHGVAGIDHASSGDVTFIRSAKYAALWAKSHASVAVLVRGVDVPPTGEGRAIVIVTNADDAQLKILSALAPAKAAPARGVDPTAKVDPTASIDPAASIGPMCTVGPGAKIGARSVLVHGVYVGAEASVGTDTVFGPSVSLLDRCVIGNHCNVAASVVIGADGFGYTMQPHPSGRGRYLVHIPHLGNVVIGDHVDIGSGTCIDRAKFGSTSIGSGTKIDNLVQIGHNCRIGQSCIICGQVGLSGSVTLGNGVMLAGKVGVADNITIGNMARVGANGGVMNDIPAGETWLGAPAMPAKEAARNLALFRRLSSVLKKLKIGDLSH